MICQRTKQANKQTKTHLTVISLGRRFGGGSSFGTSMRSWVQIPRNRVGSDRAGKATIYSNWREGKSHVVKTLGFTEPLEQREFRKVDSNWVSLKNEKASKQHTSNS